ncbi:hypothetical protein [Catenulispora sp. MAP5-51]|uniref:hypothetical protein n=1 Tax=unclassified Catenulispora TaxID=414885 RepID=UPI00351408A6
MVVKNAAAPAETRVSEATPRSVNPAVKATTTVPRAVPMPTGFSLSSATAARRR